MIQDVHDATSCFARAFQDRDLVYYTSEARKRIGGEEKGWQLAGDRFRLKLSRLRMRPSGVIRSVETSFMMGTSLRCCPGHGCRVYAESHIKSHRAMTPR